MNQATARPEPALRLRRDATMGKRLHLAAALLATVIVTVFCAATLTVELLGTRPQIALVKQLIVFPGLAILIPALVVTGLSGNRLARGHRHPLVGRKMTRMRLIAGNGILILVPCALYLSHLASANRFDARFATIQGLEICAGITNIVLMALNIRDGLRIRRGPQGDVADDRGAR